MKVLLARIKRHSRKNMRNEYFYRESELNKLYKIKNGVSCLRRNDEDKKIYFLKQIGLFLVFTFLFTFTSFGQQLEITANCKNAYQNIIALKLDSGSYFIAKERRENPGNKYIFLLENYIDFLSIYCSGENDKIEEKKADFDARIKEIKNLDDINSPLKLYIQAEIQLHTAVLLVKNNEYFSAIFYLRRSLKLLEQNMEKYPNFKANKKSLGLLYSILGSVPDQFKTGLSIIGLNGDVNEGMKMLKTLSEDKDFFYQHETATIYAFMLFHLNNEKEKAWQILKKNKFFDSNSKMDLYSIAHIGIYGLHNDEAITSLQKAKFNTQYQSFPLMNFMLGLGKTYKQDEDANVYFQKFLNEYTGEDYIKSAYQKMAWNELILQNDEQYFEYIDKIRNNGRTQIDADKQAEKEIYFTTVPNHVLLKVRLLSDGNYNDKALEILDKYNEDFFIMPKDKAEFQYRKARIFDKQNKNELAITTYKKAMEKSQGIEAYFGANACYLIANIYEKQGDKEKAKEYYEKCLKMNAYEYHNSIMQKAKAGKNRVSGRTWY